MHIEMFDSKLFKFGNYKIRVTWLNHTQTGYGHTCLDINMTYQLAKREGSLVYFISNPTHTYNTAVLELEADGVLKIRKEDIPSEKHLTQIDEGPPTWPYYRRLLVRKPIKVSLPPASEIEAVQQARQLGLSPDTKIVTFHVREPGWYNRARIAPDTWDNPRNGRIASYYKALDYLVSQGYTVVRIGDPATKPIERDGVIDLATSPLRTDLLEIYCLLESQFFIASESGVILESELTDTPTLIVNVTDPIGSHPVRKGWLFLLKRVIDRKNGHPLSTQDMLAEEYQRTNLRDLERYYYIDNTLDEILDGVIEMIETLNGQRRESDYQRKHREMVTNASNYLWDRFYYTQKWGAEEGFIGDSCIADSYARKHA